MNEKIWVTVDRPGYFGKKRDSIQQSYDEKYGRNNWRLAHEFNGKAYTFQDAIQIYEDAYYEYLKLYHSMAEELSNQAKDVYDNAVSNIGSKLDYSLQENNSNHYQDISVRRVMFRLGHKFKGSKLIQIRHQSEDEIGQALSPGYVPFHLPRFIQTPQKTGWWEQDTVESFWQSNKILQVLQ